MSHRSVSQRRYLASLVSGNQTCSPSRSVSEQPQSKPFQVSLTYTLPKRATNSTLVRGAENTAAASTSAGLVPRQPPSPVLEALPPPPRRGRSSLDASNQRKAALALKEDEYDGSEQGFTTMLLSRLRQQCSILVPDDSQPSRMPEKQNDVTLLRSADALQGHQTLWEAVVARNALSVFRTLPVEVLVLTFEFSNVTDLCRLAQASKKANLIASSPVLWMAHCKRFRLRFERSSGLTFVRQPKEIVREYIEQARQSLDVTLQQERARLHEVEQRLSQRMEQAPPFSQELTAEVHQHQPMLVRLIERAERQLTEISQQAQAMEAVRRELLLAAQQNREMLAKNQAELSYVLSTIEPERKLPTNNRRAHDENSLFSAKLNKHHHTVAVSTEAVVSPNTIPLHGEAIDMFERKVTRVVLNSVRDLPLILRRGTQSFSTLELLVLQLRSSDDAVGQRIMQRWNKLKAFFPLNVEYCDLTESLRCGEGVPSSCASRAALIRKMISMSDSELEDCIGIKDC